MRFTHVHNKHSRVESLDANASKRMVLNLRNDLLCSRKDLQGHL
jgi:hypothetical protein